MAQTLVAAVGSDCSGAIELENGRAIGSMLHKKGSRYGCIFPVGTDHVGENPSVKGRVRVGCTRRRVHEEPRRQPSHRSSPGASTCSQAGRSRLLRWAELDGSVVISHLT